MHLVKRILSIFIMLVACIGVAYAQYTVQGAVVDSTGVGEPYATVRIYTVADTTKAVSIGVTGR